MDTETDRSEDLLLLNAFVDGELPPARRAAVAARLATDPDFAHAHVTLARLKACAATITADVAPPVLPARRHRLPLSAYAAATAAVGCIVVLASADVAGRRAANGPEPGPATSVTLTNLPVRPLLPHLDLAGLALVSMSVETVGAAPALIATYLGPHGCRLDLRAGPAGRDLAAAPASSRHTWTAGDVRYELAAYGMPQERFAIIAEAAETQTRSDRLPQALERRLREARAAAPPCTG